MKESKLNNRIVDYYNAHMKYYCISARISSLFLSSMIAIVTYTELMSFLIKILIIYIVVYNLSVFFIKVYLKRKTKRHFEQFP